MITEDLKNVSATTSHQEVIRDILSKLADLNRNIVSDEFEDSLEYLKKFIDLKVHRYKTGSECWTWNIPPKWTIKDAYIKHQGKVIASFKDHPLHVMSYSVAVNQTMAGEELLKHIHVHREKPDAIPYEFSFYVPKWGFCLTHVQRNIIKKNEMYEVVIDSAFEDDYLSVGEYTIKGKSDEHVFFLAHLDHPYQVNDGLIGCAVNVALAKLLEAEKLYYNYTFLFIPETIGSIAYLSRNEDLIPKIRYAVYNEATGLDNPLVLQESYQRRGLINDYALYALEQLQGAGKAYPYLSILGNDEKVFNAPGVDVPAIAILRVNQEDRLRKAQEMKKKAQRSELVWPYPEYHSHLDNINTVNYHRVQETVEYLYRLSLLTDRDFIPKRTFKGPAFLTKFNLHVDWHTDYELSNNLIWLMYCMEGDMTVFQIAKKLNLSFEKTFDILNKFYDKGLIEKKKIPIDIVRA